MTGKHITIVTGATGGIGREICRKLVSQGVECLMLACRNTTKTSRLADELRSEFPDSSTEILTGRLDLASLASVREFAASLAGNTVDALINNAGIMPGHITITEDGIETATQTNAVAPVLLTELLLPLMHEGSCVVMTVSVTRKMVRLRPDWIEHAASYHGFMRRFKTYGRSKLVLTHYALYLSKRVAERGIRVNCADPGVVDSGMISMGIPVIDRLADIFFRPLITPAASGAMAALSALTSPKSGMIFTHNGKCTPIPASYLVNPLHSAVVKQLLF